MSSDRKVPWPPSTGAFASYPLQCHCAAIQYTITISPPLLEADDPEGRGVYTALECDCTHCERKGLISCHPKLADVNFIEIGIADAVFEKEQRGEYYCGPKKHPHWFCKTCGSTLGTNLSWICENVLQTEPRATINLRMLRDIRPSELQKRHEGFMRTQ
ncbi:hypothetical protein MBLNU13_g00819t2 [Cladosporium sp. NU13]